MKKNIYIILFVLLGVSLQFFVQSGIETLYLNLLLNDFETWSFGLSWSAWWKVHHIMTGVLLLLGMAAGFWAGKHFWKKIYGKDSK